MEDKVEAILHSDSNLKNEAAWPRLLETLGRDREIKPKHVGLEEGAERPTEGTETLLSEIVAKDSPNLGKDLGVQIQEACGTYKWTQPGRISLCQYIQKTERQRKTNRQLQKKNSNLSRKSKRSDFHEASDAGCRDSSQSRRPCRRAYHCSHGFPVTRNSAVGSARSWTPVLHTCPLRVPVTLKAPQASHLPWEPNASLSFASGSVTLTTAHVTLLELFVKFGDSLALQCRLNLTLTALPPQSSEVWNYRFAPPHPVQEFPCQRTE
jgi:hypothetical protein